MGTWRDKQEAKPDPTKAALDAMLGDLGIHPAQYGYWYARMELAIDAYDTAMEEYRQCDEPGCTREGGCGWPTDGGYRRTCYEHSCFNKERTG